MRGDGMRYRAVLFDGYGTLFHDALEEVMLLCREMARDFRLVMAPEAMLTAWDRHFLPLIRQDDFVTLREAHVISLARMYRDLGVRADPEPYVSTIFDRFSSSGIYDEVRPALKGLDGCLTGVVSNADEGHLRAALARNGLSFRVVVSSESARCYKPAPGIFHEALNALQVSPEDALYVGDSQEDDVVGARRVGMSVAWVNRRRETRKPDVPEPDFELQDLTALPEIVN